MQRQALRDKWEWSLSVPRFAFRYCVGTNHENDSEELTSDINWNICRLWSSNIFCNAFVNSVIKLIQCIKTQCAIHSKVAGIHAHNCEIDLRCGGDVSVYLLPCYNRCWRANVLAVDVDRGETDHLDKGRWLRLQLRWD